VKLINRLGSDDYADRKEAEKTLAELGEGVLPALRKAGRSHADADVRLRAIVLAAAIEGRLAREVHVFKGHAQGVFALALSPDGRRVASGAWQDATENVGCVWDVATGKELYQLVGHTACVGGVAWSADGRHVFTGGNDGRLMKWDAGSGKLLREYTGDGSAIRCVALSGDGSRAVTCGFEREARVWDLEKGPQVGTYADGPGVFKAAAVLHGGKAFAAASTDGPSGSSTSRRSGWSARWTPPTPAGRRPWPPRRTASASFPAGWTGWSGCTTWRPASWSGRSRLTLARPTR
jgi:dipeptidyl aminopeptidase/acylaminoacyl peptidase